MTTAERVGPVVDLDEFVRHLTAHGMTSLGPVAAVREYLSWSGTESREARPATHPRYNAYREMIARCHYPSNKSYPNYGGRGIQVCDRWRENFWDFVSDVGPRPAGTSLDRIDNDGNYEPGNVRWATPAQQMANRRIPPGGTRRSHCIHGHEFTPENAIDRPDGGRRCRTCKNDEQARRRAAKRASRNSR